MLGDGTCVAVPTRFSGWMRLAKLRQVASSAANRIRGARRPTSTADRNEVRLGDVAGCLGAVENRTASRRR